MKKSMWEPTDGRAVWLFHLSQKSRNLYISTHCTAHWLKTMKSHRISTSRQQKLAKTSVGQPFQLCLSPGALGCGYSDFKPTSDFKCTWTWAGTAQPCMTSLVLPLMPCGKLDHRMDLSKNYLFLRKESVKVWFQVSKCPNPWFTHPCAPTRRQ